MDIILASYTDPLEAQIALGRLLAEGIDARLDDAHSVLANWEWRLAVGGARLRVDEADARAVSRFMPRQVGPAVRR